MFTRTSPAAGRAREPRDVAIKYFKQQKKKPARGFPCAVPRAGLGSLPGDGDPLGTPVLLFPGWNHGERAGRTLRDTRGSSGMVRDQHEAFLQVSCPWSRGSTFFPTGWRVTGTGAAQGVAGECQPLRASPDSLLCSSTSGFFKIR